MIAMCKRKIVAGVGYELRAASFEKGERWKFCIGLWIARISDSSETQQDAFS
jgi:hypothetical protein